MMLSKKISMIFLLLLTLTAFSCKKKSRPINLNVFSLTDDIKLGKQVSDQINSDPTQFPVLSERGNEEIYRYVRGITQKILNSGKVKHKDDFVWEVKIIKDDKTLNAFCTPGGYIYVYTGLIKFLDSEDQLAGVMGHEIAHADLRHSTSQLTQLYGVQVLLSIVTGKQDPGIIEQIALSLASLKNSRRHEAQAEEYSVVYLSPTEYNAAGAAGFFKKMEGQASQPQFISTHPNPKNRVVDIAKKKEEEGCRGSATKKSTYTQMKNSLPR